MAQYPSGRIVAALAAFSLAVGAVLASAISGGWRGAEDDAATHSRNLGLLVEHYLVEQFDQIDLGLLSLAYEASQNAASGRIAAERLDTFLARNVTALSEASRFGIADARGRVIYSTGAPAGTANLQEYVDTQEFFIAGASLGDTGLHIARRPEPTDPDGLYLSRRVEGRDGAFLGVAFARLPLRRVADFLSRLDIGPNGGVSLRDLEMRIVVRYPDPQMLFRGNNRISPELKALLDSGASRGTYYSGSTWDGTARTVTFARVGKYPLYIAVGLAPQDYLADWRRTALLLGLGYVALLAAGVTVLVAMRRRGRAPAAPLLTVSDAPLRESRGSEPTMEPPMTPVLPAAIADYFAAANAANGPKAALCFTVDGVVVDEAQPRRGTAEIAAWVVETQEKYRFTATPAAAATEDGRTRVTARVEGEFSGSPIELDYVFALKDGRIAHLEIG